MITIPNIEADPTLLAIERAIEYAATLEQARGYLGMSGIGDPCERKCWYDFRWTVKKQRKAALINAAADGYRSEDVMAERLRMVEGIELHTHDPDTGEQIAFTDLGGHFRGHGDGAILGILQAPKTWHVWENKAREDKFLVELEKLKQSYGEKNALKAWNETYYAQAVLYMHYSGLDRHYLTCCSPGARRMVSVRTDADTAFALRLIEKARRVIHDPMPPPAAFKPDYYRCKWCDNFDICHKGGWPERNCRTCLHVTPMPDGTWHCTRWNTSLDIDTQRQGCPTHLYIPALVPGKQHDATDTSVIYVMRDGTRWEDSEKNSQQGDENA